MKRIVIFIILILFFSRISIALEKESIAYQGDQVDPQVDGKYVSYLRSVGKDAQGNNLEFNVMVYDSGKTSDAIDDIGEIEITNDGATHKYSNLVISGRYLAWLDNNKDIYVYDMGEDEQINVGQDPGIKKLDIEDDINNADLLKQRKYTEKDNLALSNGIIVWDDFDISHGDKDVRGYIIEKEQLLTIANDKIVNIGGNEFQVNEDGPYIEKKL